MALHLQNGEQNEHVNVHEVRGFIASDVLGALNDPQSYLHTSVQDIIK